LQEFSLVNELGWKLKRGIRHTISVPHHALSA